MPLNVLKWTSHKRSWRPAECRKPRSTRHRPFPLSTSIAGRAYVLSLRGKRFRLVSEPRKTAKRDFRFCRAKNGTRAITWRGGREWSFLLLFPTPSPLTRAFFRAVCDSRSLFFASKQHGNACYRACLLAICYKQGRIYRCGEFDYIFQFQSWVCGYLYEFSLGLSYWLNF